MGCHFCERKSSDLNSTSQCSMIEKMFTEWKAVRALDHVDLSQDISDFWLGRYRELQLQIIAATAGSEREFAIQYFVATDGGYSEPKADFEQKVRALLGPASEKDARSLGFNLAMTETLSTSADADPLLHAIADYRAGEAAFCSVREADWPQHGGEDAVIQMTYGPPLEVLENWSQPARTRAGAIEALRFAQAENQVHFSNPTIVAMVGAALAFLESQDA